MPHRERIIQPFLNAIILGAAFMILTGFAWVLILDAIQEAGYDRRAAQQEEEVVVENLVLNTEGELLFSCSLRRGNEYSGTATLHDIHGQAVKDSRIQFLNQAHLWTEQWSRTSDLGWNERLLIFSDERISESRKGSGPGSLSQGPTVSAQAYWYLVHDGRPDGAAYFVGYDAATYSRLGYLGTMGYRPDGLPKEEWFHVKPGRAGLSSVVTSSGGYWSNWGYPRGEYSARPSQPRGALGMVILRAEDGLYRVDFWERTVKRISKIPSDGIVSRVYFWHGPVNVVGSTSCLPIRTSERIITLDLDGKVVGESKLPEVLREVDRLTYYETPEGRRFGMETDTVEEEGGRRQVAHLTEFSTDGTVVAKRDIPFPGPLTPIHHGVDEGRWIAVGACILTAPIQADIAFLLLGPVEGMLSGRRSYAESLRDMRKDFEGSGFFSVIPFLIVSHLFPVIWGAAAWGWARRYGLSANQRKAWAAFVYLFGLPGLVGFFAHRKWPHREACPSCGKKAPVDHDSCVNCGLEFPPPAAKGIEVFAR
jgi:hypothetical protein